MKLAHKKESYRGLEVSEVGSTHIVLICGFSYVNKNTGIDWVIVFIFCRYTFDARSCIKIELLNHVVPRTCSWPPGLSDERFRELSAMNAINAQNFEEAANITAEFIYSALSALQACVL